MSAQPAEEPRGFVARSELYRALARIDDLRAEVSDLRRRLGLESSSSLHLQHTFRLTRVEGQVLCYLIAHKAASCQALFSALYDDNPDAPDIKILGVFVHKLRRKLATADAPQDTIQTIWGSGWRISDEGRAWLDAIIEGAQP